MMHPYVLKKLVFEVMEGFANDGKNGQEANEAVEKFKLTIPEPERLLIDFYITNYIASKGDYQIYMFGEAKK